jgi:hypothetical protein
MPRCRSQATRLELRFADAERFLDRGDPGRVLCAWSPVAWSRGFERVVMNR